MDRLFSRITIAIAAFAMVGAVACSSSTSSTSTSAGGSTAGGVSATEKDFAIDLASTSAPAGSGRFNMSHRGASTPEFAVIKTDDAPDARPTKNGVVDEDKVKPVAEQ